MRLEIDTRDNFVIAELKPSKNVNLLYLRDLMPGLFCASGESSAACLLNMYTRARATREALNELMHCIDAFEFDLSESQACATELRFTEPIE